MLSLSHVLIRFIKAAEYFCDLPERRQLRSSGNLDDSIETESCCEKLFTTIKSQLAHVWASYIRLIPLVDDNSIPISPTIYPTTKWKKLPFQLGKTSSPFHK